ncbi:hypothetical protein ACMC9I_10245 [Deinococcota bacterium DY0809b]
MKKWMLGALLLGLLSACNINIILPGTSVVVDGPAVESEVLGEGESARFELLVGTDPVRIDATDVSNGAAGSLRLRVFDANNAVYAQTVSRQYFTAPQPEVLGAVGLGITPNGVYSVNLPANFGKAYVEVTNLSADPTMVRVAAVTRQDGIEKNNAYTFNATDTGALLFLGQLDTWTYTGAGPVTLELVGGTTVHARAKVVRGFDTQTILEPGEEFTDLQNGDVVYVQAQGSGALAGFCNTLAGCVDGITSGEYTLQVTP